LENPHDRHVFRMSVPETALPLPTALADQPIERVQRDGVE
jgi:hypothetical protein